MRVHERIDLTRYVIAYVIITAVTLLVLTAPLGVYIALIIALPSLVLITLLLVSDLVRGNPSLSGLVRGVLAPSLFIYLFIDTLSSALASVYHAVILNYLMNFLALVVIGALVIRASNQYSLLRFDLSRSFRYAAYTLIALGLGYLFSSIYKPLFYPFAIVSVMYLALAPLPALARAIRLDLGKLLPSTRPLALAVFGIGLLYTVLSIPKPVQWNVYVLIAFVVVASIAITYAGYRLLIGGLMSVELIEDEVYEAHKRGVKVVASPEYARLEEAVREFVAHGKKEKLLTFLVHELTRDGLSYDEIMTRLSRLINYSSISKIRCRVSRKLIEMEVKERIDLVNELFSELFASEEKSINYSGQG